MNDRTKAKVLENLGLGNWENSQDIVSLHIKRAERENLELEKAALMPSEIDDHETHIFEHTKYVLSDVYDKRDKKNFIQHIREHKKLLQEGNQAGIATNNITSDI